MKAVVLVVIAVVILSSSVVPAQDVHDISAPLQSNSDVKKQERESESEDELSDDDVADAVDENTNEERSLESTQIETVDDIQVEMYPADFEGEVTGHDPTSDFHSADEPESKNKESSPADEQEATTFPPPFEQSTVDSSDVAQVDNSVMLIDADMLSQMCIIVVVELVLQIVTDH